MGKTYSEVFDDVMPRAVRLMMQAVRRAQGQGKNVIWDQTSTTWVSRKKKFITLPKYEHIAVVFATPEPDELARRLASRPGKNIPKHVMDQMINGFEMPTLDEGFTEIILVK
jgi:tRNA uridine 5-carbamoylmethylation protein Kti12